MGLNEYMFRGHGMHMVLVALFVAGVVAAAAFAAGLLPDAAWASSADSAQAAASSASGAAGGQSGPEFRVWPVVLAVVLFVGVALIAKFGKRK